MKYNMQLTYHMKRLKWNNIFNNHKEECKYINKILIYCRINNLKVKVQMFKIKIKQFQDRINKVKNKK